MASFDLHNSGAATRIQAVFNLFNRVFNSSGPDRCNESSLFRGFCPPPFSPKVNNFPGNAVYILP